VTRYDVFNGDADGLCALHQLRLEEPAESVLVTGVKRDVALLGRVPAERGDQVTVLDVSAATNHDALVALLERGALVRYFDHHDAGALPRHPGLTATIDPAPGVCTAMLVDRHLRGRQRPWAIVAAFGDNMAASARALAAPLGLDDDRLAALQALGEDLAYNAYGETIADLIVAPDVLYRIMQRHADPFLFLHAEPVIRELGTARRADLAAAEDIRPALVLRHASIYLLPDAAWSRRVCGVLGNRLANGAPDRAHAVLVPNGRGGYAVNVRAPAAVRTGAGDFCRQFPTGGGRAEAAGINHLPQVDFDEFARRLDAAFAHVAVGGADPASR
jgi:hypothetical protein